MDKKTYTTVQGDMWDNISLKFYGSERYIDRLINANFKYREEAVFSAGIVLSIPEIDNSAYEVDFKVPSWRTDMK